MQSEPPKSEGNRMIPYRFLFTLLYILLFLPLPLPAAGETPEELYGDAKKEYQGALAMSSSEARNEALRKCVGQLQHVAQSDSQGRVKDKTLYLTGQIYHRLYDTNRNQDDFKAALEHYRKVIETCRTSSLADDAQYLAGVLYEASDPSQAYLEFRKVVMFFPDGDMKQKAAQKVSELEKSLGCSKSKGPSHSETARVQSAKSVASEAPKSTKCPTVPELRKIQHWSGDDYSRVVLYTSGEVAFEEKAVQADPAGGTPARVSVDLKDCLISPKLGKVRVADSLLEGVQVQRRQDGQARVVIEAKPIEGYRVFSLADPFRIIVDVRGKEQDVRGREPSVAAIARKKKEPGSDEKKRTAGDAALPSLARQLSLDIRRVMIDPGHGGKDKGAISPNNVFEKDITLAIARELKKVLERDVGCEVMMTRSRDRFVSLEERTAIANAQKADLFISVHTNAHTDRSFSGTETYFLSFSKDTESARVAAVENATSSKRISDLEAILQDLMLNTKMKESAQLAAEVQRSIIKNLKKQNYENAKDLGTKQAPFCVLIGAEMPSILIETAFLSNDRDEALLKDGSFQTSLARGIASGVGAYMRQIKGLAKAGDRK